MNIDKAISRYVGYSKNARLLDRKIAIPKGDFINAIIGPRRAGKTSLMMLYSNKLAIEESNKIFVNGEDIDFVGIRTDDLDGVEEATYRIYKPAPNADIYLFIDEVQNFPSWQRWLRTLFDEHKYNIFISGSTSELSTDKLHSELRGRVINTMVLPFSFEEQLSIKGIKPLKYPKAEESAKLLNELSKFIEFGGYPEIVKSEDESFKQTSLASLYSTVIQRDLVEKYRIRKITVFRNFMNSVFGSACRELSTPTLTRWFNSQNIKISDQTASNYIRYAQDAFLIFLVYPYSRKIRQRNTKPKLYAADSGILSLFDANEAKKLENQVFVELLRRRERVYYYKAVNADVDFVIVKDNHIKELIQVSYSINNPETQERELKSLLEAADKLECRDLTIITFNEWRAIKRGRKIINVVPAWKWFLGSSLQ